RYWYLEPCKFVMGKLEGEAKIFGRSELVDAWRRAVLDHPLAYLQHRLAFMMQFLSGTNLVMWTEDIENRGKPVFADRPIFAWLLNLHEKLRSTPIFKPVTWFLACVVLFAVGWRQRQTPAGAFALGVCGSAIIYVGTYFVVGVASDFRYAYWSVLAAFA